MTVNKQGFLQIRLFIFLFLLLMGCNSNKEKRSRIETIDLESSVRAYIDSTNLISDDLLKYHDSKFNNVVYSYKDIIRLSINEGLKHRNYISDFILEYAEENNLKNFECTIIESIVFDDNFNNSFSVNNLTATIIFHKTENIFILEKVGNNLSINKENNMDKVLDYLEYLNGFEPKVYTTGGRIDYISIQSSLRQLNEEYEYKVVRFFVGAL